MGLRWGSSLGLGSGLVGLGIALAIVGLAPSASAGRVVYGSVARVEWSPAKGPVATYGIYVARGASGFPESPTRYSDTPSVEVDGAPGDRVRIRVAAISEDLEQGPFSPTSEVIEFRNPHGADGSRPAPGAGSGPSAHSQAQAWDFDGDGRSDLLLRGTPGSAVNFWIQGSSPASSYTSAGEPVDGMRLIGSGDLDRNGHADPIWQDLESGELWAWLVEDSSIRGRVSLGASPTTASLEVGDFDGDGVSDLAVHHSLGVSLVWLDAQGRTGRSGLTAAIDDADLACAGDFDGDGDDDLLLQPKKTATPRLLRIQDGEASEQPLSAFSAPAWQALLCTDADGDGTDDIVWLDPDSERLHYWRMQDGSVASYGRGPRVGKGYRALLEGDFDGDGREDDILIQNGNGKQRVLRLAVKRSGKLQAKKRRLQKLDLEAWSVVTP